MCCENYIGYLCLKDANISFLYQTYKTLHGTTQAYICEMLHWYHPTKPLRFSAFPSLVPIKHKTIKIRRRLCDTATAMLWNKLLTDLRCEQSLQAFKKHVKTYLF